MREGSAAGEQGLRLIMTGLLKGKSQSFDTEEGSVIEAVWKEVAHVGQLPDCRAETSWKHMDRTIG
jgi:hypothetical protein